MTTLVCNFSDVLGTPVPDGIARVTSGEVRPGLLSDKVIVPQIRDQPLVDGSAVFPQVEPGNVVIHLNWGNQSTSIRTTVPDQETVSLSDCIEYDQTIPTDIETARALAISARESQEMARQHAEEAASSASSASSAAADVVTEVAVEAALDERFYRRRRRSETRTIYVRETGDDATADGSSASPYREIRTAVDSLAVEGPVLTGTIVIDVGPGTYKGGIRAPITRGTAQDDFLIIRGSSGGYPNVPSAIISHEADTAQSRGFLFEDGLTVQLENIKIQGGFSTAAIQVARRCYLHMKNVHMDGMGVGTSGLSITASSYYVNGGCIIENFLGNGVQEFFGTTRTWTNGANTNEAAPIIRNCGTGFRAKEDCSGHLEFINFEDNNVAVEMHAWCTANVKGLRIVRNTVGIALINSEIHNEGGVRWGAGVDANSREIVSLGSSSELNTFGWDPATTLTTGAVAHRPLTTIAADYDTKVMTVATANTWLVPYSFPNVLRRGLYAVKGKKFRMIVTGRVFTPTADADPFRLMMRVNGQVSADIYMPGGVPAGTNFRLIVEVVATSDNNTQLVSGWLEGVGGTFRAASRAHGLFGRDGTTVELQMTSATIGSRIDFLNAEVQG